MPYWKMTFDSKIRSSWTEIVDYVCYHDHLGQMLDLGVDGLVTDRPDIAATLLKERGVRW